jgi:hypothetical protein
MAPEKLTEFGHRNGGVLPKSGWSVKIFAAQPAAFAALCNRFATWD